MKKNVCIAARICSLLFVILFAGGMGGIEDPCAVLKLETLEKLAPSLAVEDPNNKEYFTERDRLTADCTELQKKILACSECHDYKTMLELTKEGVQRFPPVSFFAKRNREKPGGR